MRIDISTAKKLVNNYKQNHWPVINGSCPSLQQNPNFPNVQDSRSVWFNLVDLQCFINDIKARQADGVRIYFGEYSADIINNAIVNNNQVNSQLPANFQQYTGLHTLVMIPTMQVNGISRDFNYAANTPTDFSQLQMVAAENHGTLIPPPFYVAGGQVPDVGQDFMIFCDQNP